MTLFATHFACSLLAVTIVTACSNPNAPMNGSQVRGTLAKGNPAMSPTESESPATHADVGVEVEAEPVLNGAEEKLPAKPSPTSQPSRTSPAQPVPVVVPESEKVTAPSVVTGAYFVCRDIVTALDNVPAATVGCRFEDSNKRYVPASLVGSAATYRVTSTAAGVTASLRVITDPERIYEALVNLSSNSGRQTNLAADNLRVQASLTVNGAVQTMQNPNVQPAQVISNANYTDSFVRATDVDVNGNSTTFLIDRVTGYRWTPDSTAALDYAQSNDVCEQKVIGPRANWRLPTINEMRALFANGFREAINASNTFDYMNIVQTADYYTLTYGTALDTGVQGQMTFIPSTGAMGYLTVDSLAHSLCVSPE